MTAKRTLSTLFLATAMVSAQQIDPIQVIKNQIDMMHAQDRIFDRTFLGVLEKQHNDVLEGDAYLDSIHWPHMDDPDEHGRYQSVLDFQLGLDHQYREKRLENLQSALKDAQAGLPLPTYPDASQKIPLLLKMMAAQLATENEQYPREHQRKREIKEIEKMVGLCIDTSSTLDDYERTRLKSLTDAFLQRQKDRKPSLPLTPAELRLVNDVVRERRPIIEMVRKLRQDAYNSEHTQKPPQSSSQQQRPNGNGPHSSALDNSGDKPQHHETPKPQIHDNPKPQRPDPLGQQKPIHLD